MCGTFAVECGGAVCERDQPETRMTVSCGLAGRNGRPTACLPKESLPPEGNEGGREGGSARRAEPMDSN